MSRALDLVGVPVTQPSRGAPAWLSSPMQTVALTGATTVTADATAHTKGAWTELIASTGATAADLLYLLVAGIGQTTQDSATLIDVGIGAAAAEVVVAGDIAVGSARAATLWPGIQFYLPVDIPAGSRVAVRIQSVWAGGKTGTVQAAVFRTPGKLSGPKNVVVFGTSTATSEGTVQSASNDTYVEITAGTTQPFCALILVPSASATNIALAANLMTLGVGPVGAELAIGWVDFNTVATELCGNGIAGVVIPGHRPAGTRIATKLATGTTTIDATVIGVPYS